MYLLAISLSKPTGFWPSIIFGMEGSVKNYALALIIVTVLIKIIMVPFDFINKYSSKKSSRQQAEMKPELDKINAKYAHDKNLLNQKTMEVYKSHNFNVMGTCVGMLVYLVLTMVVFWTLFSSLNGISYYKIGDQFLQVRESYYSAYEINVNELDEETTAFAEYEKLTDEDKAEFKAVAEKNANEKYNETKTSFLWIENIWLADTTVSPIMKYDEVISKSSLTKDQISADEYNLVMSHLTDDSRSNNGLFLLAVLAAGITYLSTVMNTWISKARAKKKGLDVALVAGGNNKIMTIIMPLIMGVFTLFYNAAFGLYIVAGAIISLLTSPLVTLFVDMLEYDAITKERKKTVAVYDRKRM